MVLRDRSRAIRSQVVMAGLNGPHSFDVVIFFFSLKAGIVVRPAVWRLLNVADQFTKLPTFDDRFVNFMVQMASGRFLSYLRVSTAKQGKSGLGIDAQRKAVADYLNGGNWSLITEVVEHESGKRADRPKLEEALRLCRIHNATLVIARLDRLSRDAAFLLNLQNAGVRFVAADMPEANEMVVGIMGVMAQAERKRISSNTKLALAQAKARGVMLGGDRGVVPSAEAQAKGGAATKAKAVARAADLLPLISEIHAAGAMTLRQIADALNARGIPTARSNSWSPVQVKRVIDRAR